MSFSRDTIPDWLLWLLSVLEVLIVLAIACLVGFTVFCFLSGSAQQARFTVLMETVDKNWKAALVLLIPLFYRPMRAFLENLEEAGGWKRGKRMTGVPKEETNAPTEKT
jgi:high-affinity Fe2+/Pb2+ permease